MTYFPKIDSTITDISDGVHVDAFHRLRVGLPFTVFDSKQAVGNAVENIQMVASGTSGGTSSYSANRASTTLWVAPISGSRYIRQSRRRMNYQSGKSLAITETFTLGTGSSGIVKRVGYFDERNGIFLEQSGSDVNMVIRSFLTGAPVETRVSQSAWSINKFDGTDIPASITRDTTILPLQVTASQIFWIDFQWLGVGRVRTGFAQNGNLFNAHHFEHADINTGVYMSCPNQPIRYEIENYNTGGVSGSLETICASVISEGDYSPLGLPRSASRLNLVKAVGAGATRPLLSIKLLSGSQGATVIPTAFSTFVTTADNYRWMAYLNPVYSGADNPVWNVPSGSSTSVVYDMARDGEIVGGILIDSGYAGGTVQAKTSTTSQFQQSFNLGYTVDGVSDEFVIAVQPITSASFLAQINWIEQS